ncbi:MAG: hypothetical protein WD490_07035, partial [Opitutales bacterium]
EKNGRQLNMSIHLRDRTLAHFFTQLILHSNLFDQRAFGSAKNFARRLAESFRLVQLPEDLNLPGQIRFRPP